MSRGAQKPTINDALAFVATAKETLVDEKEKFENFLNVMLDFQAQRIDVAGVKTRVKELFEGHKDLILGFKYFLPMQCQITFPLDDEQSSQESVESNILMGKMKTKRKF